MIACVPENQVVLPENGYLNKIIIGGGGGGSAPRLVRLWVTMRFQEDYESYFFTVSPLPNLLRPSAAQWGHHLNCHELLLLLNLKSYLHIK